MTTKINVISSDLDGKELRQEKRNKYHFRVNGKEDAGEINQIMADNRIGNLYSIPAKSWERIFGGKT